MRGFFFWETLDVLPLSGVPSLSPLLDESERSFDFDFDVDFVSFDFPFDFASFSSSSLAF